MNVKVYLLLFIICSVLYYLSLFFASIVLFPRVHNIAMYVCMYVCMYVYKVIR